MTTAVAGEGQVSAALESDLRRFVLAHGIAVWLDPDGQYSAFVDRLAALPPGALPYDVRAFRGSYLALMQSLEGVAGGADQARLVVHLPGLNQDSVRETPMLELWAAGRRYQKALATLVTDAAAGQVRPDRIAAFTSTPGITLDRADAWLAGELAGGEAGAVAQMRAMAPSAVFDDLLTGGAFASGLARIDEQRALRSQLAVWTGLSDGWCHETWPEPARVEDLAFAAASWVLAVEYVDDLRRPPVNVLLRPIPALPRGVLDTCRTLAAHLRDRHPDFYERTADETELLLADEVAAASAADLGKIDTFRFEEDKVLAAALAGLDAGDWAAVADWAGRRMDAKVAAAAFWLRRESGRQAVWQLVHDATRLGQAIDAAGERLAGAGSVSAALAVYAERGSAVDQAHRHLEQRRTALLYPRLPEFDLLRARLDGMRRRWRTWADTWARDFNAICRSHGFLPDAAHQQRTLFDEVVRPLAQEAGVTAFFLVDAFRYEMGEELYRQLADTSGSTVHLKARLAELPTVTEVGMNVLAPVAVRGRLEPFLPTVDRGRIGGFAAGEFRVADADTRKRAMHDRVGGHACPWLALDEVVGRDTAWLKRSIAQAKLVVVHTREIDNAGEAGVGPVVFDETLQKLRAAWHLLRDAGVRRFVFTGDHGFLLHDESAGPAVTHGGKLTPRLRYVFSPVAADHAGEVRVALADLAYDGVEGHLMCPDTTAIFDRGKGAVGFVHGGNSLQERAIPVITVVHRTPAGGSTLRYAITATDQGEADGMHHLKVAVETAEQGALDFGGARDLELSLRVRDVSTVHVELCQVSGSARLIGGSIQAQVGGSFDLFFRLSGPSDTRVHVELYHPAGMAEVAACVPDVRFAVAAPAVRRPAAAVPLPVPAPAAWLDELPEGGVRQVFAHLAEHGAITEEEAMAMLGGPRSLRRFALGFDAWAKKAPWGVRIDVVAGMKRYVREGGAT